MSSNLFRYAKTLHENSSMAIESGVGSMASILPCLVCRELEVTESEFVASSDPIMQSFRALPRNQRFPHSAVPRKIEFGSAVYLKEALINRLFPHDVNVLFIGDSNSDKRFAYNFHRLAATFSENIQVHCFISNSELVAQRFGDDEIRDGWDENHFFYHANSWTELARFREDMLERYDPKTTVSIVDMDGTLLCPRPEYTGLINEARLDALVKLCADEFDKGFFDENKERDIENLTASYHAASATGFSSSYDDADLTALIALAIYAGIIEEDDALLNPRGQIGFVLPIEVLNYASFVIENSKQPDRNLGQLHSLFGMCADALRNGAASAFSDFRRLEETVLLSKSADNKVVLNKYVIQNIHDSSEQGSISIGFSDRPNESLGLIRSNNMADTCEPKPGDRLINTDLPIR